MANIEKREDGWYAEGSGPFTSRDAARDAVKRVNQDEAEATYAENLAATEALDAAEDTEADALVSQVVEEFPEAESFTGGFEQEEQELADGSVARESAKEIRARENYVVMALYGNTEQARAYWTNRCQELGYEVPVMEATV